MNSWISINLVFYLIGIITMVVAFLSWRERDNPKRHGTALFWFLFGFCFLFGDLMLLWLGKALTYRIAGVIVLLLALIAGANGVAGRREPFSDALQQARSRAALRLRHRLFIPALAIPLITVALTLCGKDWTVAAQFVFDQKNLTLAALALACLCSLAWACKITGGTAPLALRQGQRLVNAIGWALILPQMLAMLGGVLVVAKTGHSIQVLVTMALNPDNRLALVAMYCIGMALFTMIMGNAFAAFPVMSAGIALPFLIVQQHANPAIVVAIGMFSGYCGTLMTPMAANFNIVPAALLELQDQYQVIKVQVPTALAVLLCNIVLMMVLAFP
jgi:uncharacterized membrane protein